MPTPYSRQPKPSCLDAIRTTLVAVVVAVASLCLAASASAANHTVEARPNNTFSPSNLTIQAGDTVTFQNAGGFHNVEANDGSFRCAQGCDGQGGDGNPSSSAWSFTLTFNDPGTINYFCEVHVGLGMTGSITVQAAPQDEPGDLRFSVSSINRSEGAGSFTVQVDRVNGDDGAVGVTYSTSDGSAQAGVDYTPASGSLSWPDGNDDPRTFQVPILDDGNDEPNETINVALSNPTGGAGLASPSNATLMILDDDDPTPQPGTLSFVSSQFTADETSGSATVTVQRTNGTEGNVSVDFGTSDGSANEGVDYTAASGTLTWSNGEGGTKSFQVPIVDDELEENDETVNLALSNPTGGASLGTSTATLEIDDDDRTGNCVEDETTLCVRADNRFRVSVTWRDFEDNTGPGKVIPFDPADSGLFYFFGPDNAEILLKVLDACTFNDRFWFFAAATTNVEYTITVTDTKEDVSKTYFNPLGEQAAAVTDTSAFATCP
ncbi:MAG: plastocyanin/azurin family copper-binding protein [Thermoanaerobaculia bacterium]|nr:plastocyanin/azurin family copper-binding protein [Thermoanaerobaculia bacterium]